jgi:O-antigen ligase/polysaccharide polymerase Wzy-like membrane protein
MSMGRMPGGGPSAGTASFSPEALPRRRKVSVSRDAAAASTWGKRLAILILITWVASLGLGFQTALVILTTVGFAAAIIGIRIPSLGLLGIGMLCTLDSVSRALLLTGGLLRWNTLNYGLLFVMMLSLPFLLHLRDPQTRLIQGLVLVMVVGILFSNYPMSGVQDVLNVVTVFGILAYFARTDRSPGVFYWMAVVSGILAGGGGLVFFLKESELPEVNANSWSFFPLTAIFAIALAFSVSGRARGRNVLALLAVINAVWVFLSGSRGSLFTAIVCLLYIMFRMKKSGSGVPVLVGSLLIAALVTAPFLEEESYAVHRLDKMFDSRYSMTSRTSGRSDLALGGWYIFQEHPFGVGTGGFGDAWIHLNRREGLSMFREGVFTPAHSGWIKVLAENGILGILALLAFVFSFAVVAWRKRRHGFFPLGLVATISLGVAFLADEFQGKGLWFLAAGVMTVLNRESNRASSAARGPTELSPVPPLRSPDRPRSVETR